MTDRQAALIAAPIIVLENIYISLWSGISVFAVPAGTVIHQVTFRVGRMFVAHASRSRHRLQGSSRGRTDRTRSRQYWDVTLAIDES
jgi:hypothetical protein